jgi:hypothetical protein
MYNFSHARIRLCAGKGKTEKEKKHTDVPDDAKPPLTDKAATLARPDITHETPTAKPLAILDSIRRINSSAIRGVHYRDLQSERAGGTRSLIVS